MHICYATLRYKERFDEKQPLTKKMHRQVFAMPGAVGAPLE